ncbi:prolyl oligopeptidase family serine peptidase [Flagellimonas sp.]|uniref:S9 family peptidase n=1 Tax=Flagellimonas sp. TaxID=2058762 RepID=UPI003AB4A087
MYVNYIKSVIVLFLLIGVSIQAQHIKKIQPEDYERWSFLIMKEISGDGMWTSYGLRYEVTEDTLFVKHTQTEKSFNFPATNRGSFSDDSKYFGCLSESNVFSLLDLDKTTIEETENIRQYGFSESGRYMFLLKTNDELILKDLKSKKTQSFSDISSCSFDPKENKLAYLAKTNVGLIDLSTFKESKIIQETPHNFQRLTWHPSGKSLAFLGQTTESDRKVLNAYYYQTSTNQLYTLNPMTFTQFPDNMEIVSTVNFKISQDGRAVFMDIHFKQDSKEEDDSNVQIWYSNDQELYPWKDKRLAQYLFKIAVWVPKKSELKQLQKASWSRFIIGPNENYALAWDIDKYKPSFAYEANADIYLVDLQTGAQKQVLENFGATFNHWGIHWSQGGKYINYFKDKHWWVYDLQNDSHKNVTYSLKYPVYDTNYDRSGLVPAYGSPGWITNDKEILIYDQYDLWAIDPKDMSKRRLTNGREQAITYRIYNKLFEEYPSRGVRSKGYDFSEKIAFEMSHEKTKKSGYAIWDSKAFRKLVYGDFYVDYLKKAPQADIYMYRKQRFDVSPQLIVDKGKETKKILVQSNPQQDNYYWGKSELVDYTNTEGKPLQAVLFYPANYDPDKTYPMIVNIYQKKSYMLHHYQTPSPVIDVFNATNFVNDDYFVLYPDITYTIDNPGRSALDCVTRAVEASLRMERAINKDRLGLLGHSFGGYETTFIIGQTDMFSAAIAGAPMTDLVSYYLSIGWNTGKSHAWRFEHQQLRFSGPYYQLLDAYIQNSPINNIEGIDTPLLHWFGDKDGQVDWYQGIELYNALRRKGKENIFLVYPDEGHVLSKEKNKRDYTKRIQEWFGSYLKDEVPPEWMVN